MQNDENNAILKNTPPKLAPVSNGHSHTYLQNAWLDWQCNPSNPNWEPTKVFTQGGAVTAGTPLYKFTTIASNGPYLAVMWLDEDTSGSGHYVPWYVFNLKLAHVFLPLIKR